MALDVNGKPIGLTDEERDRIVAFANKPPWARSDDDLLPD